jgi:hypothetical protein
MTKTAATALLHAAQTLPKLPPAPPPAWRRDELTKFRDGARTNQYGTVANKLMYQSLSAIDALFFRMSDGWLNPVDEIGAMLLLRSHSAFRAAAGLACAGQVAEAFAVNRSMLEFAAYALHLHKNVPERTVWLNRHVDAASMEASRNALSHNKVRKTVEACDRAKGKRFEDLYQIMIDFGGHPNERSVTGNMKMVEEPDRRTMLAIMLHGDGWALDHGLVQTARCGMCSLDILQGVFPARFELLGIVADMREIKKVL